MTGRKGELGFLLAETLILSLLTVLAAGAFGVYAVVCKGAASSRETICADYLAREELAYLEAGDFSGSCGWLGPAGENQQNGVNYSVTAEITVDSFGTRRAEVRVSWRRKDGRLGERILIRLLEGAG